MIDESEITFLLKDITQRENIKDYLLVIYGQFNQEIIVSAIKLVEKN
jgi:hypothetical protein